MTRFAGRYTPSPEDAVTAYRMHQKMPLNAVKLQIGGGALMIVVFAAVGFAMRFPEIIVLGLILSPIFFVIPWLGDRSARRYASKQAIEEVSFEITSAGISYSSRHWQNSHAWPVVKKARVDERGLIIYTSDTGFSFLPARAFGNEFPAAQLDAFVKNQIQNGSQR